jgi:hypothetical protein
MDSRAVSPRVLALAIVVAIHAGVVLVLLVEMRARLVRGEPEATPLLVMLLQEREPQYSAVPPRATARPSATRYVRSASRQAEAAAASPTRAAPGSATDWAAEATASAARQIEANEQRARRARALTPKPSPLFSVRPRRPEFHWDYASTHRVEPVPGLGAVIHLNDRCAIALFVIIPFAGSCALGKIPARGDLFEHMHDPDPAPEP